MNEIAHRQAGQLTVQEMSQQVNQIQALMRQVMKEDVHFGKIPGTPKKALLKPGAEKIGLMFGLRARYDINRTDLPDGHREYEIICNLENRDGDHIGSGVGTCTTMEKKYRYRAENTNQPVPREYWEQGRNQDVLGGPQFVPRKVDGKWMIFQQVDYDNPADYYNTVLKMGKKRAYNDAIITCTAASDFFDQEEVIDSPELHPDDRREDPPEAPPRQEPKAKPANDGHVTKGQLNIIRKKAADRGLSEEQICHEYQVDSIENLPAAKVNEVLSFLDSASN